MKPLTFVDIGSFLQSVFFALDEFIIFAFVIMVTFTVALYVKQLLIWGS
jgi:hypothetical protein